ncbi:hypothetical protein CCYA_CCYA05G1568 [Cyanidiococcus yangmingshanensis]|nr:hypothetical protein CCYA_CCYA05G1568 [Cyanidiococcus yangmingshanensis]
MRSSKSLPIFVASYACHPLKAPCSFGVDRPACLKKVAGAASTGRHPRRDTSYRTAIRLCCNSVTARTVRYGGIQHVGVIVSDLRRSLEFYLEALGMEDDNHLRNPRLPFGGAFVKAGNTQIHLMLSDNVEIPPPSFQSGRPEHGGRDYHIAVTVNALEPLESKLGAWGVPFTMSKSGRRALFCRDPDGNALEFIETPGIQ